MSDHYCEICKQLHNETNHVIKISDDKESVEIDGHENCVNELYKKLKNIKDLNKKSVKAILKEINYKREV
jgi:hypothetical protein